MPDLASLGPPQFESRCRYRSLSLADSGHDGSERTAGSRTPKDERSESFGIRTGGRRSRACGLTSFGRSGLRLPGFESRCRCCSLSLADSGHDGIRTHGHRMSSRAANATRIEVRRSVRTELRALESLFYPDPKRRCGAGLPPERRLPNGRRTGTMGVSEPQVRERRKTSGASLSEFEPTAIGCLPAPRTRRG